MTRRVRVIVDPGNHAGDFSRIIQMLQASAQPYAGLNRLSPFWLVATRDLDNRGIVYVDADVLIELDGLFFFLEISFITHSTEEKTRFGPKAAARSVRNSREEHPNRCWPPLWFQSGPGSGAIRATSGHAEHDPRTAHMALPSAARASPLDNLPRSVP